MRLALALLLVLAPLPASAERYLGTILATAHPGDGSLSGLNPGLTLGRRWDHPNLGFETQLEAGIFRNSYGEVGPILLYGLSTPLGRLGPGTLRLGASAGLARYDELSRRLRDAYGIPSVAGVLPIVAATLSWRVGRHEVRLSALPPDRETRAVLNLSVATTF